VAPTVLVTVYLAMMARAFPGLTPVYHLVIGPYIRTPVRPCSRCVGSCWSADFPCSTLLWKGCGGLKGLAGQATSVYGSADYYVSRGLLTGRHAGCNGTSVYFSSNSEIKLVKREI